MAKLPYKTCELFWIGDSKDSISSFPRNTKRKMGCALRQVQNGVTPDAAEPLKGLGASGVYELKADEKGETYRVVYLIKLKKGVYVLDAFHKKSKKGKTIPKEVKARIRQRAKEAREYDRR